MEPGSPALQADSLPAELPGKPRHKNQPCGLQTHKDIICLKDTEIFFKFLLLTGPRNDALEAYVRESHKTQTFHLKGLFGNSHCEQTDPAVDSWIS